MNVIEMPHDDAGYNLSVAEINCLGTLLPMCAKYRKKGKCLGNCDTCAWGSAQKAYDKLDDFQKTVVQINAARHYVPDVPSFSEVADGVCGFLMYAVIWSSFIGIILLVAWAVGKVFRGC